jgi:hypothetical protein
MEKLRNFAELKQRLLPNKATTLLIQALGHCDDYFGEELMWPDVRKCIMPGLYRISDKRDKLITDDTKAARMVMSVIAQYAEGQVCTGIMHTYRGILGFDGQSVRNIAELALSYLHEYEYLDYEDYQKRLERLDQRVKEVG